MLEIRASRSPGLSPPLSTWRLVAPGLSELGPEGVRGTHGGSSQALGSTSGDTWVPHCTHTVNMGCSWGCTPEGGRTWASPVLRSDSVQCTCTTRLHTLLHHSSVTSCSEACDGTGTELKMGELPHIPPSHPCRRKGRVAQHGEGNWDRSWAAGEDDGLPAVTTCCLDQLHRGTGGRAGLLLPRYRSSWAHRTMRKPWDAGAMRHERAAGTHPALALRQAWGSVPAPRGTAGYARNVPNESGLDCGRSGRRAAQELTHGLGQSQSCCKPLTQSQAVPQWLRVLRWHWCCVGVGRAMCCVVPPAPRGAAFTTWFSSL